MVNSSYVRYLLALNRLYKADGIRSVDIAHELEVTKTSVHNMIETFVALKYVNKERGGLIYMTRMGIQIARCYQKQYDIIYERLFSDCMTDNSAEKAICALIAELSEATSKLLRSEQTAS